MNVIQKTGRNEQCYCGSGKKYKKCCGQNNGKGVVSIADKRLIQLNEEAAYNGEIGASRERFCENYIHWKKGGLEAIGKKLQTAITNAGKMVTCKEGCSYCCSQYIVSSLQENEAIAFYLYNNQEALCNFLKNYPIWRDKVKENETLYKKIGRLYLETTILGDNEDMQKNFLKATSSYFELDIPCPFLHNGSCTIYEVRPFCCVSGLSTTPAEWCKASSNNLADIYTLDTSLLEEMPYFRKHEGHLFFNTPLGVYEILKGGTEWISRVIRLAGLEQEKS